MLTKREEDDDGPLLLRPLIPPRLIWTIAKKTWDELTSMLGIDFLLTKREEDDGGPLLLRPLILVYYYYYYYDYYYYYYYCYYYYYYYYY